ncbi:pyridoxamine 5'-phosphate oxidase [Pleurocapsa sp. CCALA 161]|uniref:pyridoxamine 5'-phosphate oxidase n=1 Tax=Pleurocapsa sp. CCALA 161 TaxID=2107688 RepID=UPI000D07DEE3|nr:pyridoxamine 5'-phosphate oxidase [Pleurocapsa sp. CCALA 161]PSB07043.1 pyridoxamine 5'-phosphate oxidase [Pleurocapsa sp. CCALA 161]
MDSSIADLRQNYTLAGLTEADLNSNPIQQFKLWFEQALAADLIEPNAMTLATATPDGKPSARIVLLKGVSEQGFVFYTNYASQKGQQLLANPYAALVFLWDKLERQIRIEGKVEKLSSKESLEYFHSRPKASQLGAWASAQSQVIPNREVLEEKLASLQAQYSGEVTIPLPPHWGGFRVVPDRLEFWQGRPSRLHDRLVYKLEADSHWSISRLSP